MRRYFYCDNRGSELVLQDIVWLGGRYAECPLCGDDTGAFMELVPQKLRESEKEEYHE
jgi:hypothetical protein